MIRRPVRAPTGANRYAPPVVRETAPLSAGQERLIDSEYILPDGQRPAPRQPNKLRPIDTATVLIDGDLDVRSLRAAIGALVSRQAALRTIFRFPDTTPAVQLVTVGAPLPFTEHPVSAAGEDIPIARLRQIAARQPVDPTSHGLFTVRLIPLNSRRHILMMQIHHLISDGWSIGVLYRELSELYNAFAQDRAPRLPLLPRSFAQVCASMRRERESARMTSQLRYWHGRLRGPWPQMPLWPVPADPYRGSTPVNTERVTIPRELVSSLRAAGQSTDQRGGLAGPVLSALAITLYADGGAADVRVGTMVANRTHSDVEHLIGYFVNIAVIRVHVDPGRSVGGLVAGANATVAAALDNQDVPIQDVLLRLREDGDSPDAPVYQVTLALNSMRPRSLGLAGLECTDLDIESFGPRLAPTTIEQRWFLEDRDGALSGTLTYKTDTLTREDILTTLRNLDRALRAVLTPQRTVADVIGALEPRRDRREA